MFRSREKEGKGVREGADLHPHRRLTTHLADAPPKAHVCSAVVRCGHSLVLQAQTVQIKSGLLWACGTVQCAHADDTDAAAARYTGTKS